MSSCLRRIEETDERVKEKEGELKQAGGSITYYCMCYSKPILNCDGRRHLSEAVKVPMNHTALTDFFLSLSVYLILTLNLFLSPIGTQPVTMIFSLSLFVSPWSHIPALSATWDVLERNEVHLSLFSHSYTHPATCCFISLCLYACRSNSVWSCLSAGSHHCS